MLATTSELIPGLYPKITKMKPRIGGNFNLGVGIDSDGIEYVLKRGDMRCVAEFVGTAVCAALAMPHCKPRVVCRDDIDGNTEYLFGSVVEAGLLKFDRTSIVEWHTVVATLCDASLFTVALASALCLGNDDHHADNWLVRDMDPANGILCHSLVPMDFGNAWPACNPAHHPMRHPSPNTWEITRHWRAMGITFDQALFRSTCARMQILDRHWLQAVLTPLVGIWLTAEKHDALCDWWQQHWRDQVVSAVYSLEPDGDWL